MLVNVNPRAREIGVREAPVLPIPLRKIHLSVKGIAGAIGAGVSLLARVVFDFQAAALLPVDLLLLRSLDLRSTRRRPALRREKERFSFLEAAL